MNLPRGITGFRDGEDLPLPTCDLRAFRSHCHAIARAANGRVMPNETSDQTTVANFTHVTIEFGSSTISVVLNLHYPVIAFVSPVPSYRGPLEFVEAPLLSKLFQSTGTYTVLTPSEAQRAVTEDACRQLAPAELRQLQYWRPQCIGDIVFNLWD